jgi:hypothetical protein
MHPRGKMILFRVVVVACIALFVNRPISRFTQLQMVIACQLS